MKKTSQIAKRNISGARIRAVRIKSVPKITLEDLAGRLAARGVTLDSTAVSRIETGERYILDYELKAIALALKVPVNELLG